MTRRGVLGVAATLLAASVGSAQAADVANMSGKWRLNIEKSDWGKKPRPNSVEIDIEHHEPALKYSGKVTDAQGGVSTFAFDGAVDGKTYSVKEDNGTRNMVMKRVNGSTTSSEIKSADGKTIETTTTTLSRDGKTLTRRIVLKTPDGTTRWTELYERAS